MSLLAAVRQAASDYAEFTVDTITEALWDSPDFQHLAEPDLRNQISIRLAVLRQRKEVVAVGSEMTAIPGGYCKVAGRRNIYRTA